MLRKTKTAAAIDQLKLAIKKDKGYYETWHANIACCIRDEIASSQMSLKRANELSDKAATRFLTLFLS